MAWRCRNLGGGFSMVAFAVTVSASFPGSAMAAPAGSEPPSNAPGSDILERLVRPELKNQVSIEYPPELAQAASPPRGNVVVRFVVGVDGVPKALELVETLDPTLDALALEAVGKLRYTPATLDGNPVEVRQSVAIPFEPPAPSPPDPTPTQPQTDPATPAASDPSGKPSPIDPDGPIRLEGTLLEAGQRTPIADAKVVVVAAEPTAKRGLVKKKDYAATAEPLWETSTVADAEGSFSVAGIPTGKVRVIVLATGYERLEYVEEIGETEALAVKYFLQRSSTNPYRTVVRVKRQREEVARRTISLEEINNLPGTQGDALKAVQNFPGIARAPFGLGQLAIRGTGPNDSAIFLGYHEIPQLFHFGGLTSVFNSDILQQIDFVPGNFDSRYGDAIGGIITATPRAGRRDGYHGYIDSDVFDTGILFEGPIGKGSFALSARRSYIDFILPRVVPDDAGLDLTLAPRYYDYQALFDYPIAGGTFKIRFFGSDDRLRLVAADPNEISTDDRNRFESTQYFHRVDLEYSKKKGPWTFLVTPSYRHSYLELGVSDFLSFNIRSNDLRLRAEVERELDKRVKFRIGADYGQLFYNVDVEAPPLPDSTAVDTSATMRTTVNGTTAIPALYATFSLGLSEKFTLFPGVRVAVYTDPYDRATVDPRIRFGWDVADRTTIKGGIGIYSQMPDLVESTRLWGNPRIGPEHSLQNSLGIAQSFDYGIQLDATVFFNYLWSQSVSTAELVTNPDGEVRSENFANIGTGRLYGAEILLRKELTSNVFGWLAYTISRSERKNGPNEDFEIFDFDQTHILTLIGVYRFPRNWQVGGRFRLVSGNPNTPFVGSTYDASEGAYIPIEGRRNSDRFPIFHQLDLRVDKKWVLRRLSITAYLDIQNVYNAQNVEFWNYSFDFNTRTEIAGLPIIPSIGVKVEF